MKVKVSFALVLLAGSVDASGRAAKTNTTVEEFLKGDQKALAKLWSGDKNEFSNRGDLFARLAGQNKNGAKLFKDGLSELTKGKVGKSIDLKRVGSLLNGISTAELVHIAKIHHACELIGPVLQAFRATTLSAFDNQPCIVAMIEAAKVDLPKGEFVQALPKEWAGIEGVIAAIHSLLHNASVPFLKEMNNECDHAAKLIDDKIWSKMKPEQLKTFTAKFFAKIPNIGVVNLRKVIPLLADNIFQHFRGPISDTNAGALSSLQFSSFNVAHPASACAQFPLHKATEEQLKTVTLPCILSYLVSPKRAPLGSKWSHIRTGWTTGIKEEQAPALRYLFDSDKQHIPTAMWDHMLQSIDICENIVGNGTFKTEQKILASPECLAKIRDNNLIKTILLNPKVDENIFAKVNAAFFESLKVVIGGKEVEGLGILKYIKSPEKAKIVENISVRMETGEHGCYSINSAEVFHELAAELANASKECLLQLQVSSWSAADLAKSPILLSIYELEDAIKLFGSDWKTISAPAFAQLLKKGVLKSMTLETFNEINLAALSAITSKYLLQIKFIESVTAERMKHFANAVFEAIDYAFFGNITFEKVSDKQLPYVSVAVSKPEDRVFVKFTAEQVKNFGPRFSLLSALQLEAIPANAYVSVTEEQFTKLKPEALANVTSEQMEKVDSKVRAKITIDQARQIGSAVADRKKSPLNAFIPISSSLSKEVREVIEKRTKNGAAALAPTAISLAAALAAAVIMF